VFVANLGGGNVQTLAIGSDGSLTQQGTGATSGPPPCCASEPEAIAISADGQHLYVANQAAGTVSTFAVGPGGTLTAQQSAGVPSGASANSRPRALAISVNGQNLYAANSKEGTVSAFAVASDGTLTAAGGPVLSGADNQSGPDALAVSPDGHYVYVANSAPGTISTFAIGSGGALTQLGTGVITGPNKGSYPNDIAISPDGRYLYAANGQWASVSTFVIGANGALTQLGTGVKTGGSSPEALLVSPNRGAAAASSQTASVGDQQITFTAPAALACQAGSGRLQLLLGAQAPRHSRLRFQSASFYIDKGVKHTRKVRRQGKTVTITSYSANAVARTLPVSAQLALAGVLAGSHSITVKLVFTRLRVRKPITKTITTRFSVC
jgi:6-phosphogluconolactonase (cycloisomerase 2 family)